MRDATLTDGERWAREQLALLLADRFTPAAVARFLAASFRRSAQVRAARPDLARASRLWLATGALAYLVTRRAPLRPALAWWAVTALMLDWHLGMLETPEGEPRPLGPADALTLARAWLVPVAAERPTPLVCAVAAATDVLDGAAARATAPTRAGRDLEGLVDACFAAAALRGLRRGGRLGPAPAIAETARLAVGFAYALVVYFGRATTPDPAVTRAARATTSARVAGLLAAGAGRRRAGDALLAGGCAWSVAAVSRALLSARR